MKNAAGLSISPRRQRGVSAYDRTDADMEKNMPAKEEKDADLSRLLPCPFCGGGITEFNNNGRIWTGTRYGDPVSVSVLHWCHELPGPSRMIERIGRNEEEAIARWNMRSGILTDRGDS